MNKQLVKAILLQFFFILFFTNNVFATSPYVLPYPGIMPGNKLYKLLEIKEAFNKYWYFGDFARFGYNLKMSDKYLVEAKTLFDYKQYLLGSVSLSKSDQYFYNIKKYLIFAKNHGKDNSFKNQILQQAILKHLEELEKLKKTSPEIFEWIPEKDTPTVIKIRKIIDESITLRKQSQ